MEEEYLIAGFKEKDKVVFDFIFNYYYSGLCAFANRYVKDRDVAEDLVQDFFVRLWLDSKRIEVNSSLKSYLFQGIKNRSVDYLRHQKTRKEYSLRVLAETDSSDDGSVWNVAEFELKQLITDSLKKLPHRTREIFILSRFKGKSNETIAEYFNISRRTVEVQISNALRQLRIDLSDYFPSILLFWIFR